MLPSTHDFLEYSSCENEPHATCEAFINDVVAACVVLSTFLGRTQGGEQCPVFGVHDRGWGFRHGGSV